jgi:hypothetical protein
MNLLQSNKSKIIAIIVFVALGLFTTKLFAQEKDVLREKLENLKGKVEKITLKVDGKDAVFEGKDAEMLFKKLQKQKIEHKMWIGSDDMDEGPDCDWAFISDEDSPDVDIHGIEKKVKVEDKDGKKSVTITTTKDGKEETKVLSGEEAEKFIKEDKAGKFVRVVVNGDGDAVGDKMVFFNHRIPRMSGCGCCCCGGERMPMHMNMRHDKGMRKMIIKEFDKDDKESKEKTEKK